MKNTNLPHGSALIYQFIKELGGITDKQIDVLLGKEVSNKEYLVNYLRHSHIKEVQPGMFTSLASNKKYTREMEMCAWVLLDNQVSMELNQKDYYKAESPAQLFFQKDNKIYNVAYIDANRINNLLILQELYYSRKLQNKDDDSYQILFVIDRPETLELIQNSGVLIPMTIAYVKANNNGKPEIEYYTKE